MATILVVDDRPTSREYLLMLLTHFGHRVLEASDGIEALEVARAGRPDVIITDIRMPRMDGLELAARLQADPELSRASLVIATASYDEALARELARAGRVPR